jgi:protein gp37
MVLMNRFLYEQHNTFIILTKRIHAAKSFFDDDGVCPPNVWIGVSCSTQAEVDRDLPMLLTLPVQTKILSLEPLLERVEIPPTTLLSWVIAGCESGPKKLRRHIDADAFRDILRQCDEAETPCYIKQIEVDGKIVHQPWTDCLEYPDA